MARVTGRRPYLQKQVTGTRRAPFAAFEGLLEGSRFKVSLRIFEALAREILEDVMAEQSLCGLARSLGRILGQLGRD